MDSIIDKATKALLAAGYHDKGEEGEDLVCLLADLYELADSRGLNFDQLIERSTSLRIPDGDHPPVSHVGIPLNIREIVWDHQEHQLTRDQHVNKVLSTLFPKEPLIFAEDEDAAEAENRRQEERVDEVRAEVEVAVDTLRQVKADSSTYNVPEIASDCWRTGLVTYGKVRQLIGGYEPTFALMKAVEAHWFDIAAARNE